MKDITVKFSFWDCNVHFRKYGNGRTAIQLTNHEPIDEGNGFIYRVDECPIVTATINLPDEPLEPDEVIIKDYSENEGMLNALVGAKIISDPIRTCKSGFITGYICKLLLFGKE